jgi:hypothetical protein
LHLLTILVMTLLSISTTHAENLKPMSNKKNCSQLYAGKINALPILDLPSEWLNMDQTASVEERFTNVAMKQTNITDAKDPKVIALTTALKEQFFSGGEPFRYEIYLNQPMSRFDSEGAYILYIVSINKNMFIQIKGIQHKNVVSQNGDYSDDQLSVLKQLFVNDN